MSRKPRSEFELIEHIRQARQPLSKAVLLSIGDDAALLDPAQLGRLALSMDTLVEGSHFQRSWISPYLLGRKSCLVNVSDLAAMGAAPVACLLSLVLPADLGGEYFDEFIRGFLEECNRANLPLIGGDLCRGNSVTITVTVWGSVERGDAVLRNGARAGDAIAVVGDLGLSRTGLEWLVANEPQLSEIRQQEDLRALAPSEEVAEALLAHFLPRVPLLESGWIRRNSVASSMIDVSDGLVSDLQHILEASRVSARLFEEEFDRPATVDLESYLQGGEDYALLLTLSEERLRAVETDYPERYLPLRKIGTITAGKSPRIELVRSDGRTERLFAKGYDHFR